MLVNRSYAYLIALLTLCSISMTRSAGQQLSPRWVTSLEYPPGAIPRITGSAVADNGDTVVALGKRPGQLSLVDGATGNVRWQYTSRRSFIAGVDVSARGKLVLKDSSAIKPDTEVTIGIMVMLDNGGNILWEREAYGNARISPLGDYILACDPENDIGLDVYDASNGTLLWNIPASQLGKNMQNAVFTSDGQLILVHTSRRVSMFTVTGELLWAIDFRKGVISACTSRDGSISAILVQSVTAKHELTRNLVIVDGTGEELAGIELLKFKELEPPDPEIGDWYQVAVSSNGDLIVLEGLAPGVHRLQAVDPAGNLLWEKTFPSSPEGSSTRLNMLASGVAAFTIYTHSTTTCYFLDDTGTARETAEIPGSTAVPRFSANGSFMSAFVDSSVYSFAVAPTLAKVPNPTGRKLAKSNKSDMSTWVALRHSLKPVHWSLHYDSTRKEATAVSIDRKYNLRVTVGSREAVVNGREILLPAAPRVIMDRIQVPASILKTLNQTVAKLP